MSGTYRNLGGLKEIVRPWYLRNVYFRAFPSRKPPGFENCWHIPHAPIDDCEHLLDPRGPASRDFLILPMSDWHTRIQRSQFLAQALAALGHRCLLLNPHLGREFRGAERGPAQLARLAGNIYELHVRLPREPVYHHRTLSDGESEKLAGAVSSLVRLGCLSNFTQIVGFPVWLGMAQLLKERFHGPLIYDCHDRLDGFAAVAPEIVALEPGLIAASDLVICSADRLREHCLSLGASADRCSVVRNAVWGSPGPPAFRRGPVSGLSPVIGYLGALEDWFDRETIRVAALARPGWRFVLAGRVEFHNLRSVLDLPNVEFSGEISRDRVPDVLARFDVATIPFVLNRLTIGVDPIKLYEYLAAGLPVVSARLPETKRFANYIHYYDGAVDFVQAVEAALRDGDEAARVQRQRAVRDETWESRGEQVLRLTESHGIWTETRGR